MEKVEWSFSLVDHWYSQSKQIQKKPNQNQCKSCKRRGNIHFLCWTMLSIFLLLLVLNHQIICYFSRINSNADAFHLKSQKKFCNIFSLCCEKWSMKSWIWRFICNFVFRIVRINDMFWYIERLCEKPHFTSSFIKFINIKKTLIIFRCCSPKLIAF